MKVELEKELYKNNIEILDRKRYKDHQRCPYILYGTQCQDGWYNIIKELLLKIKKICGVRGVEYPIITQIKEKFGILRVYYSFAEGEEDHPYYEEVGKEIHDAIHDAVEVSKVSCEVCGAPGILKTINRPIGIWLKTLCDKHFQDQVEKK